MKRKPNTLSINIHKAIYGIAGAMAILSSGVIAQTDDSEGTALEEVFVTGTRIQALGEYSSSPVTTINAEEIDFRQQPDVERILRDQPAFIPADGSNVNNGTAGASTLDLRGLGAERNLILINGKRAVPYNFDGQVDVSVIPTALIKDIQVLTGGASTVYGSDAIAGAVNFILDTNFEGVELTGNFAETAEQDGERKNIALTVGSNFGDDRGNAVLSLGWSEREPVLLGQRPYGVLGIVTEDGSNYEQFLNGEPPVPPIAGCGGPDVVASGGSTTAIPTRFAIIGVGTSAGQFREDGTIGEECSEFNFSPYNYFQTPGEKFSATALADYEINEHADVYGSFFFTNTTVVQQVAPSGTFGAAFELPLANPFIGTQSRQYMIDAATAGLTAGTLVDGNNWTDVNGNGVVDDADYLSVQLRRRTVELGARSENFDNENFQFTMGVKGEIAAEWQYDLSYQYGESNRTTVRDGYTNLTNIQNALDSTDGVTCANGDPTCVPLNLFGGFGTITEEMAGYARAIALQQQKYDQTILNATLTGPVPVIQLPSADNPLNLSLGFESREENGSLEPDECLKLAPASCQGGAGGNLLPISGGYKVDEFFLEGILPLIEGKALAESLSLDFGFRVSEYDYAGSDDTWKIGMMWQPVEQLSVRVSQQRAVRAPNVGELFSPVTTGLDNAQQDPCSVANAANIDAELQQLCQSTGMSAAQVGTVQDVIAGQIQILEGSDPENLPKSETADTLSYGVVWRPEFDWTSDFVLTLDYYDIDITDVIGEFSAQEILDSCYEQGITSECDKIHRVGGDLTIAGAGIDLFTTNLNYLQAEGIELGFSMSFDLDDLGSLAFSANINKYLTQESLSSDLVPVLDCKGYYGTSCDPISDLRWVQRSSWYLGDFTFSLLWRHIGSVDIEPAERSGTFEAFRSIDDYDYFDLYASYDLGEHYKFTLGIDNVLDEEPPILGNEAGDTSSNSGNTFPSNYDVLGTVYTLGFKIKY